MAPQVPVTPAPYPIDTLGEVIKDGGAGATVSTYTALPVVAFATGTAAVHPPAGAVVGLMFVCGRLVEIVTERVDIEIPAVMASKQGYD